MVGIQLELFVPVQFQDRKLSSSLKIIVKPTGTKMSSKTVITLPTGQQMPALGFGTWHATEKELISVLEDALEAGYRHIDTAPVYENEAAIGKVLKKWLDSGRVKREELFIVTKVPPTGNRPEGVEKWIKKSLKALQLDYLDLYLIHTPITFEEVGDDLHPKDENGKIRLDYTTDIIGIWTEMEKQVAEGRAKAIGISNFNIEQISRVLKISKLPISNLQIEMHVYFQQKELVEFCKTKGITVTAYSPLGSRGLVTLVGKEDVFPDLLQNETVLGISKKKNKSPGQIALKFLLQSGVAAIPKSTNPKRIKENIDLFDWELSDDDMNQLTQLDLGPAGRIQDFSFIEGAKEHPEFPF